MRRIKTILMEEGNWTGEFDDLVRRQEKMKWVGIRGHNHRISKGNYFLGEQEVVQPE